ncbi:hypothetical protein AVEN_136618-1 [Araneus ventricosus]|uniref:Uncharacterized protein n=1 Tax=Araneus ventricosus TaxID=182803 RepID=A0A4Y2C9R2_ARAVE|nr:hypothetical protein AVEN_136618-1 [Araneus ventricosus]
MYHILIIYHTSGRKPEAVPVLLVVRMEWSKILWILELISDWFFRLLGLDPNLSSSDYDLIPKEEENPLCDIRYRIVLEILKVIDRSI